LWSWVQRKLQKRCEKTPNRVEIERSSKKKDGIRKITARPHVTCHLPGKGGNQRRRGWRGLEKKNTKREFGFCIQKLGEKKKKNYKQKRTPRGKSGTNLKGKCGGVRTDIKDHPVEGKCLIADRP